LSAALAEDAGSAGRINTSAHCQTVQLSPNGGQVELMIRQEGPLFSGAPFILATTRDGESVNVKGLQVELVRSSLIDEETVHGFGLAGPFTIHNRHFGVKLQISADEAIGMKIDGCIGRPVKELTVYTTCVDAESQHGRL
jgi:hypothetical protein